MGRWKASAGPGYIHPGGLISCGIFYYLLQKANTLNVLPPIPFPSFLPISLPSFFPSPLSLSLPFLFFNFRQWQVEIDHITLGSNGSHWAGVSSKHYAAGGPLSIALGERVGQWTLVPGLYWNHILVPMIFFFP